jgi:hypothetical protein
MNQSFLGVATMQEYARTAPTKAWQLTLQQIAAAPDNGSLGLVAAGPLEGLLLILLVHSPKNSTCRTAS